jgi:hypothetical protein
MGYVPSVGLIRATSNRCGETFLIHYQEKFSVFYVFAWLPRGRRPTDIWDENNS